MAKANFRAIERGQFTMMTVQHQIEERATEKVYAALEKNKKPLDIATGVALAIASSHIPFMLSFGLARINGLTASNYPAVEPTAAAAGLAICLLSLPIAYEMKQRSISAIAISSAVIFWILGLLASFTA
jgi:hypothetical protein